MDEVTFLKQAIAKAEDSVSKGGFPAGAVVVKDGKVIGEGISIGNILHDPTSHGEIVSLRDACKNIESSDLSGSTLYASMQPCSMCLSASMWASVSKIVFACAQGKVAKEYYGGTYSSQDINRTFNTPLEIIQIQALEEESLQVVKKWEESLK
jgi:tRNA(Arg) A34 adenosine deaminase TadA